MPQRRYGWTISASINRHDERHRQIGMHNNANIPIEMIESDTPLTIVRYGLLPDSAGAGAHRGGLGHFREWRIDLAEAIFTANLERFRFRPYGLADGGPAAAGRVILIRNGVETQLRSKVGNLRLTRGDVIRLETSGGGGFGAPSARDPAAIARDVALGYVTQQAAARDHGRRDIAAE